jgi:hypothetical protein
MPALPTRNIGNDDVAEVGLGLMGISAFYGSIESDEERFKVNHIFSQLAQHDALISHVLSI